MDDQMTERLLLNPGTSIFHPEDPSPDVGPAPCIRNSFLTFGSFNRMNKLNPATIRLWSRVLRRVPDSRMVIGAIDGDSAERLRAQFSEQGVDPSRIQFFPRSKVFEYLQRQTDVDINLDATPYTGGTTTYHALWMGVPTLTLAGKTLPARGGCSIMRGAGLPQFAADSEDEFVERAVHWACPSQWEALAALRSSTRDIMRRTMIGKTAPAILGFEDGIRWAWSQWCKGLPPQPYVIPPRA
jgi:predicted O-linked N-acetylglucosamine transferase (SPINDLY family)